MSKNLKNILLLYFIFIISCLIFYFYSTRIVYNNLKVIDNFESTKNSFTIKVPSKILIHNKYLGDVKINNNLLMNDILRYFSNISSSSSKNNKPIKNDNVVTLSGKIYYSNGNTENFTVNNALTLKNKTYYNNSYYINTLRNTLFNCLYNYQHVLKIINNSNSKIVCIKNHKSHTLNKKEKEKLLSSLKNFKTMEDNKYFLNINLNENPKFVFNIFIDGNNNSIANNTIYLIVYKNYLVLQYLGDENGKNIYIKGDLNENSFT